MSRAKKISEGRGPGGGGGGLKKDLRRLGILEDSGREVSNSVDGGEWGGEGKRGNDLLLLVVLLMKEHYSVKGFSGFI